MVKHRLRPSRSRKVVIATVAALAVSATGVSAQVAPAQPYFSTVTADEVTLTGNVKASLCTMPTRDGEVRVLELTGDRLVVRDLAITLPGNAGDGLLTTDDALTEVEGSVRIVATSLTVTPTVEGVRTVPVTADLTSDDINAVLDQLGIPQPNPVPDAELPDALMDHLSLSDVTLELANLTGDTFSAPIMSVTVD
ncbi:hypothetical protein GCM10009604_07650 [Corynebacterium aurimucosum]|uniref:hypothetical protein n=1 Tax=Corynebacterium aurimucosum TaxID=169292 RepID=UPI00191F921F|nr:hypothetical protein [Corynebacterium aurimucosum]QQU96271.1 hypothetical protein I6I66_03995 [Corynebacterium aurimucosum]UTA70844.1 hypothetical protein J3S22_08705 [Corynebacterium aurimucosum]WJY71461.1 hypothetical protein CAURIM_11895 [Corynebacterium aurimucosum]